MEIQKPTVGRTVHYKSYGSPIDKDGNQKFKSVPRAAIITEVYSDESGETSMTIALCVLNPEGVYFNKNVEYGDLPGQWSWPPRV